MFRRIVGRTVLVALAAASLAVAPAAASHTNAGTEPVLTFVGGGWGHGIGLSQYGAYGRAKAGHSYDEILAHYYADTSLRLLAKTADPTLADDVEVRIAVRSLVAVSTPVMDGAPEPDWQVSVMVGDEELGTATRPVEAEYVGGTWQARALRDDDTVVDLCDQPGQPCAGAELRIVQTGGSHVVIEEHRDGPNIGKYAHGEIILRPAAAAGPSCGSGSSFCVIHGGLSIEQYVYGIAEVPTSWPAEAQKAQAVAARSYAVSRIRDRAGKGLPYDLVSSTADQVYAGWDREGSCGGWCEAVDATAGEVVVHDGEVATTFYSSSNGGHSVSPVDVWDNGKDLPYLEPRPDPFDDNEANPNGSWTRSYTVSDVSRWLNAYQTPAPDPHDQLHVGTVERIVIQNTPASGRVTFADVTIHGSKKSVQLLRDGKPYGFRLYWALRQGCLADDARPDRECDALLSTKFEIVAFHDISFDDYFYTPVQWMTAEGLTTGVAPDRFAPSDGNARAQLATFLWRFAGEPEPSAPSGFDDIDEERFFADAVAWLAERGITNGTTPTTFSPDDTVNRAQAATFLWRFAGSPRSTVDTGFTDVEDGRYYTEAVRWMVEWGITTGTSPSTFSPDAPLTRGQIATFLWRLAGQPGAFADGVTLPDAMRVT